MARAYSNDLRRKLLEARDRDEGSLSDLASGLESVAGGHGRFLSLGDAPARCSSPVFRLVRKARLDCKAPAVILEEQPDVTLPELQTELEKRPGLRFCTARL